MGVWGGVDSGVGGVNCGVGGWGGSFVLVGSDAGEWVVCVLLAARWGGHERGVVLSVRVLCRCWRSVRGCS